jgi:uncharacterized protein
MKKISLLGAALLTACVTINIYFPAAAAEKVADEIIKDIQDNDPKKAPNTEAPKPQSSLPDWQVSVYRTIDGIMDFAITPAQAAEADLAIDSAEIRQLRASMEKRFAALRAFYGSGAIGIKSDGLLAVKDANSVPLKDRNQVNQLVAAENADRNALYAAIANANGHPEWASQIKATFAQKWISNAQSGWWYQSAGAWKQK